MQFRATTDADIPAMMAKEYLSGEKAVSSAMSSAQAELKANWRAQVVAAGLGTRLGNAIRGATYPKGQPSMNAAALVWSNAPKITAAHDAGPLIRSQDGFYLAIPTDAAGRGQRGARLTPGQWEQRTGRRLRFVYRKGRTSLLVADDARVNARGIAQPKRGRRRKDGILTGAQTVVIFTLVPQVKLAKRLSLMPAADKVASSLPARIVALWKD